MAAVWPGGLPQIPLMDGYEEGQSNHILATQMDAGPAKYRRRYRASIRNFSLSLMLTSAQLTTFDTFFESTLEGGALPFDWVHPRTQAVKTFRFVAGQEIKWAAVGYDTYAASLAVEVMP